MPFIIYTLLRIGAIVVAYFVLYLAGARGWLVAVLAVLVGMMISYLAFEKQRRASAKQLQNWVIKRRKARGASVDGFHQFNEEEDAQIEAMAQSAKQESQGKTESQ